MEVHFPPEQQKVIETLAAQTGEAPDAFVRRIVQDGLQRQQDYERWFRERVREGRAAAERGEFIEHEEVGRMLDDRYPG
jgi:predicted transcriptional regulator